MLRRTPRFTRTEQLFPYPTLFRSLTRFRTGGTGKVIFRSHWERAVRLGGTAAWSQRERGLGLPVGQKPLTKTAGGSLRAAAGPLNLKQDKALAQRPAIELVKMAKKITGYIKLQVPAGAANPSPPIGPALGQRGVNIMEFCKAFNAATGDLEKSMPIPTIITVYADRSFSFTTKSPPATFLIKKAAKLKSGSKEPGKVSAGQITRSQLSEIAELKMKDLNANDIEAATRIIEGSAKAMGLQVVEG